MKKVRTYKDFRKSITLQAWRGALFLMLGQNSGMTKTERRAKHSTTLLSIY
jgi:hypothetical protein